MPSSTACGMSSARPIPDEIDSSGEIPDAIIEALAGIGAFGIKIPHRYGGLGLSQTNYSRAAMLLGGFDANLTALLSAHQSIGVPQPLIAFGTEEQKRRYLPRCAKGEISAFALTESDVGSDPARMKTTATPTDDGEAYILRGEKLWCTNVIRAERPRRHGREFPAGGSPLSSSRRTAPASRSCAAATSWGCAPSTTASSDSTGCACRAKTSSSARVAGSRWPSPR